MDWRSRTTTSSHVSVCDRFLQKDFFIFDGFGPQERRSVVGTHDPGHGSRDAKRWVRHSCYCAPLSGEPDSALSGISLVAIYVVKAFFLAFLAWRQTRFAFGVQAQLSQRLYERYLRQPYVFHLQRNSAQLIRNAITEVNQFMFNGMLPAMLLLTECLVLFGLGTLLLIVEPTGALIVGGMLGVAAWGFHRAVRAGISRHGHARIQHEGLRIQHLQQGLGAAKEVILLGREGEFLLEYQQP
jgi:ABC-type multidrug transport system fused ATPase/permease subunit